jgi:hypothetical protein
MPDNRLWLDVLLSILFLITSMYLVINYIKRSACRTKYYLATLIISIVLLIISILDLILPGHSIITKLFDSLDLNKTVRIILLVLFLIVLLIFLFYPQTKRFLSRRTRRK